MGSLDIQFYLSISYRGRRQGHFDPISRSHAPRKRSTR